jgi:GTP-binding protein
MIKVVIAGRPNVGKSSLFNRLVRERDAIVSEKAGTTRDIKRRIVELDDQLEEIELIDTGGLEEREGLFEKVKEKSLETIREGNIILYMVDGRSIPTDEEVKYIREIQKLGKPLLLLVNKIDNDKLMERFYDFYQLGVEEVYPISVAHNRGVGKVIERVKEFVPKRRQFTPGTQIEEEIPLEELLGELPGAEGEEGGEGKEGEIDPTQLREIKVAIVGRVNVGKSSLLNRLVGEERSIVSEEDGTTIDPVDETIYYDGWHITFIDTAGIRRRGKIKDLEKYALLRTEKVLKEADIAILVLDASQGIVELDEKIGGLIEKAKRGVIIVANKWDDASTDFEKFRKEVEYRFDFLYYAPFMVISAKTGRGIDRLKRKILEVYRNYTKRIPTSQLNQWIQEATARHKLPSDVRGKEVKIYYATQFDIKPPQIALIMNRPKLHFSYRRYLIKFIRSKEDFSGTPIILVPKERRRND